MYLATGRHVQVLFHYTTRQALNSIIALESEFATLLESSKPENAKQGPGIYATRKSPDEFGRLADIAVNNFGDGKAPDLAALLKQHGPKA